MGKIKSRISDAFVQAQTMSDAEKKIQSLIVKTSFKKTLPYLVGMMALLFGGMAFNINIFIILAIEILLGFFMIKKTRKVAAEFNDFKPYQGNIISVQVSNKSCNLILKQGKTPIKMEIQNSIEDFKNLKKNEFISIAYNKTKKVAMLHR